MEPIMKMHSISFAIATTVMYFIWDYFSKIQSSSLIINLILTFIFSVTFYKIVCKFILFSSKKVRLLRKMMLGKYYLEGLWIGYYVVNGQTEYYYEIFEQTLEGLTIVGKAFDEKKNYIGEWSIIHPNINISESKFTYYYEMNDISSENILLGYSRATIYWDKHGNAEKLIGFAVDSFSSEKQNYTSKKINHVFSQSWINNNFWEEVKKLQTQIL